jgi:hypothetical protein
MARQLFRSMPPIFLNQRVFACRCPHIIETGTDSYRFRRTLEKRKGRNPELNTVTAPPPLSGGRKKKT